MTEALQSLTARAIDHWPGILVPIVLLGFIGMVWTATVWAFRRKQR
jgi:hypothetical protein